MRDNLDELGVFASNNAGEAGMLAGYEMEMLFEREDQVEAVDKAADIVQAIPRDADAPLWLDHLYN